MGRRIFIAAVLGGDCGYLLSLAVILIAYNSLTTQLWYGIFVLILGLCNVIAIVLNATQKD